MSIVRPFVFEFNSWIFGETKEPTVILAFDIIFETEELFKIATEWFDNDNALDFTMEMEDYGIHDFCCSEMEFCGFHTSEISPNDRMIVMEKWHEFFSSQDFCTCGPIHEIREEDRV